MNRPKFPIDRKLMYAFGVVILLSGLMVAVCVAGLASIHEDTERLLEFMGLQSEIGNRKADHLEWALTLSEGLNLGSPKELTIEADPNRCSFGRWYYGEGRQRLLAVVPAARGPLERIEPVHDAIHAAYREIRELMSGPDASGRARAAAIFTGTVIPQLDVFRGILREAEAAIAAASDRVGAEAEVMNVRVTVAVIATGLVALLLAVLFSWLIGTSITRPLRQIVTAANRIASGDVGQELNIGPRNDEIGLLAVSFGRMEEFLSSTVRSMERIAEGNLSEDLAPRGERDVLGRSLMTMRLKLREIFENLQASANVLATSINQISTSFAELSSTAAETAASVNETTATVEQVKHTAHLSSQKARQMADVAQNAARVAHEGTQAADETTAGMATISDKMDFVAENIIRLNEKSRAIADIIAAVSELADQSNILAVNASLEAARAGEEGKGFAVVAAEIRSMAVQSKEATAQVRAILNDIQKATAAAVMATEEGGKAVLAGKTRTTNMRDAIQKLSATTSDATRAAAQIAASSKEELVGMDQVALAMENIRNASSQNVDSATQLDESVKNLRELALSLKQLMGRFQV